MSKTAITNKLCLVRLIFFLLPTVLHAQERGPVLLQLPASTRALSMGDAFAVGSTDSDALFYNAAFSDRLRGASIAMQRWSDRATLYTMSAAIDWWSGAIAVGVRALDYGGGATATPSRGPVTDEGALFTPRAESISERAASVAYSRRVKGVRGALTAHVVEQRTNVEQNAFVAGDVAAGYEMSWLALGLAARNIGTSYELDGRDIDMPLTIQLSAAGLRSWSVLGLDVVPAFGVAYEVDGDVVPGGGVEISYWPVQGRTFSLRIGARSAPADMRPFTAGAGFTGDRLILDYAIVPMENDRFVHRFGIRWR
jgi:hypothetical protein